MNPIEKFRNRFPEFRKIPKPFSSLRSTRDVHEPAKSVRVVATAGHFACRCSWVRPCGRVRPVMHRWISSEPTRNRRMLCLRPASASSPARELPSLLPMAVSSHDKGLWPVTRLPSWQRQMRLAFTKPAHAAAHESMRARLRDAHRPTAQQ
jgi:hypothetical protein